MSEKKSGKKPKSGKLIRVPCKDRRKKRDAVLDTIPPPPKPPVKKEKE